SGPARRSERRALAEQVCRASEGNPFVIVETIRAVQDGRVAADDAASLPPSVRAMIRAQLVRLSRSARHLTSVAAVAGHESHLLLLQRAAHLSRHATASALEELVRRRILDVSATRIEFMHERVRRVVYDALAAPRRAALHAAVGEALESFPSGRLTEVYDRLAEHFTRAGDGQRAFKYLVGLGDEAAQSYAIEDSVKAWRHALTHADRLPVPYQDGSRLEVIFRLTNHLHFVGRVL